MKIFATISTLFGHWSYLDHIGFFLLISMIFGGLNDKQIDCLFIFWFDACRILITMLLSRVFLPVFLIKSIEILSVSKKSLFIRYNNPFKNNLECLNRMINIYFWNNKQTVINYHFFLKKVISHIIKINLIKCVQSQIELRAFSPICNFWKNTNHFARSRIKAMTIHFITE